jgi:hypothetical protein
MAAALIGRYANGAMAADWLMLTYIALDLAAAGVVLVRPAGLAQKAIGFCFAVMVLAHVGVVIASISGSINTTNYDNLNMRLGWAQFIILLTWSCDDVGKAIYSRFRPIRFLANIKKTWGADRG